MAIELVDAALPKSSAGRRAQETDAELVKAIVDALKKSPTVTVDGETRPRALGPKTSFDTGGKASSEARRYSIEIKKALGEGAILRTNIYGDNRDAKGAFVKPFHWRVYIPITEAEAPAATA